MLEESFNPDKIKAYTRENFNMGLINYFSALGRELGYDVKEAPTAVFHGINLGKAICAWTDGYNVELLVDVGYKSKKEGIASLFELLESGAKYKVIVISSKSPNSIQIEDVEDFLSFYGGEHILYILDTSNWNLKRLEQRRRKKIIGHREKEQD